MYLAAWDTHPKWKSFLAVNWMNEEGLLNNLKKQSAQVRSNQVFGNISYWKKHLLARLAKIQKALDTHTNRNLHRVELEVKEELEMLKNQKQGLDWVSFGDRNSAWFHEKWKTKNRKEVINGLRVGEKLWFNYHTILWERAREFFHEVYSGQDPNNQSYNVRGLFQGMIERKLQTLIR